MRKIEKLLILIIFSFSLTGCFNYRDINKVNFATCSIIDFDKNGYIVTYMEIFKSIKSGDKGSSNGERLIFRGKGKTAFEAIRDLASASSYKINYTQNKVIMFTERAALYGIDNFLDFFDRDQELLIRPYIAVLRGDPEKFISCKLKSEQYTGIFINELIDNIGTSSRGTKMSLNDYLTQRIIGSKISVLPIIELKKDDIGGDALQINGGAVIKEDKLVSMIDRSEGQGYNFLMNSVNSGTLEVTNPCDKSKFITLEILNNKTKTNIEIQGDKIKLYKSINVKVGLAEAQKKVFINKENLEKIKYYSEENIKKYCNKIFNEYKDYELDIFEIKERLYRKYPNLKKDSVMKNTDMEIQVKVNITDFSDTKDFLH